MTGPRTPCENLQLFIFNIVKTYIFRKNKMKIDNRSLIYMCKRKKVFILIININALGY